MKLSRKFLIVTSLAVCAGLLFGSFSIVKAKTAEEILAKIAELKAQIAELKVQLIEIQGEEPAAFEGIPPDFIFKGKPRYGMKNNEIKYLQIILKAKIGPPTYPENVPATGYFGPITRASIIKFQEKYAGEVLAPLELVKGTGFAGNKTKDKLNDILEEGDGIKTTICHVPPGNPDNAKTITVGESAIDAHLAHGDNVGACDDEGGGDTTPPVISDIEATDITATSTKITWLTDEEADSKVWYATSTPLIITNSTSVESSSDLVLNHEIGLFSLTASTTYYYIVTSADSALNTATNSTEDAFSTLAE